MRFLRVLMFVFRMLFGIIFILSGFFKLTDPVGTGLIVDEYLRILHLGFLDFGSVAFGMVLSVTEFLIGIAILMCVRMRVGGCSRTGDDAVLYGSDFLPWRSGAGSRSAGVSARPYT